MFTLNIIPISYIRSPENYFYCTLSFVENQYIAVGYYDMHNLIPKVVFMLL